MDWGNFFVVTFFAALPGLVLVWLLREEIAAVEAAAPAPA